MLRAIIFKDPPRKQYVASNWKATIKDSADIHQYGMLENGEINYDYNIVWHIDTTKHTFDPRIQIR